MKTDSFKVDKKLSSIKIMVYFEGHNKIDEKQNMMEKKMILDSTDTDVFAAVTQFYVRLRRVTGRVVDVLYMVENQEYAQHLIDYAKTVDDTELQSHVNHLTRSFNIIKAPAAAAEQPKKVVERPEPQRVWFLG
jgi:hypothetical protein